MTMTSTMATLSSNRTAGSPRTRSQSELQTIPRFFDGGPRDLQCLCGTWVKIAIAELKDFKRSIRGLMFGRERFDHLPPRSFAERVSAEDELF